MRELLGLSLTAHTVVWTLVDRADGTIIADEIIEVDSPENLAKVATTSVEAIASQTGRDIGAVRIAWSKGAAGSAVKLTSNLRSLGLSDVDLIPEDEARHSRNRTARYIDPALEIAYGAARTLTTEGHHRPVRRMAARLPARRVFMVAATIVAVLAAGTAVAGYLLVDRTPPQAADRATTSVTSAPAPNDAPVAALPAAALPLPPAPEPAVAPPVVVALPPVEATAPIVIDEPEVADETEVAAETENVDEPEVATEPETATLTDTAPTPVQAATMARQPHLAAEVPSAGSTTTLDAVHLPGAAMAPGPVPATTMAGPPHLTPGALPARPLPGPVPPMTVVSVPALPAPPPPPPSPLGILAALP